MIIVKEVIIVKGGIIEKEVIYCDVSPVAMFKMATRVLAQNG